MFGPIIAIAIASLFFYLFGWDVVYNLYRKQTEASLTVVDGKLYNQLYLEHGADLQYECIERAPEKPLLHLYKDKRGNVKLMSVEWPNMSFFYAGEDLIPQEVMKDVAAA